MTRALALCESGIEGLGLLPLTSNFSPHDWPEILLLEFYSSGYSCKMSTYLLELASESGHPETSLLMGWMAHKHRGLEAHTSALCPLRWGGFEETRLRGAVGK